MKDVAKTAEGVLFAVILLILFFWYRSDNGRIKQIKELEAQIVEYESRIEELEKENESIHEELAYYYGDN